MMDSQISEAKPEESKMVVLDTNPSQDPILGSVTLNTVNTPQLSYVVVANVDTTNLTVANKDDNMDMNTSQDVTCIAVEMEQNKDRSDSEQGKKRSQTDSETGQSDKGNNSTETTPKKIRQSSKLNSTNQSRRPRSKSENGASSDFVECFSVEDTLRHLSGSVTPESAEPGFKNAPVSSMLEDVLTEKKLALLRSPEVIQFLQKQQAQKARENQMSMGSRNINQRTDNS